MGDVVNLWQRMWDEEDARQKHECPFCSSLRIRRDKPAKGNDLSEWSCNDCSNEWTE